MGGISPMSFAESLRIGSVNSVSPDEINVTLDIEAPESVSLNAGRPRPFPRINGYVLVPSDDGYLVGQIEWIRTEPSQFPKRKGMQDFGLVDLPYPLRKLKVNPLGTLKSEERKKGDQSFKFHRGVETFPSVGDPVLIPTDNQLKSIIESGRNRRVKIGTSPLAEGAEIKVDPDRLFGRHLAVLGNTGSGKSCSVAGLIRWSLEAAGPNPNARFIVLDPNGEYRRAFKDNARARMFCLETENPNDIELKVPLWLWNSSEWCAFTHASYGAQRPAIQHVLRQMRNRTSTNDVPQGKLLLAKFLVGTVGFLKDEVAHNAPFVTGKHPYFRFKEVLNNSKNTFEYFQEKHTEVADFAQELTAATELLLRDGSNEQGYHKPFGYSAVTDYISEVQNVLVRCGVSPSLMEDIDEDTPVSFRSEDLLTAINFYSTNSGNQQWFDSLIARIQSILGDSRMHKIISPLKKALPSRTMASVSHICVD